MNDNGIHSAMAAVRKALDGRRLIWFGIRGEDGEALLQLPELEASYSITAPLRSGSIAPDANLALEEISGTRPDLDRYDVDLDFGDAAREFRRRLLREVSGRCVLMTYRPSVMVSALAFSMADTMTLAGLFKDRQAAFEYKPWVETSLARRGVRGLGWQYVADEHRSRAKRLVATGPHVVRASRASGGVGIALLESVEDVDRLWPDQADAFVAIAPYLDPTVPVNFSGCVFPDGSVRLHPPSVQLIGIPSCTDRPFGYCGNDFGAVATLGDSVLRQLDDLGRVVADWLRDERYLGAFGVDALVHEDKVYFTEINARFQGSSAPSAEIAADLSVPDLFLDHLMAALGVGPETPGLSLTEWAWHQPCVSQIVVHNTTEQWSVRAEQVPFLMLPPGHRHGHLAGAARVDPGATLCRVAIPRSVTRTGFEIDASAGALVQDVHAMFAGRPAGRAVLR